MESPSAADAALAELERIAALLEDELAGWRRRCLKAETEAEDSRHRVPLATSGDLQLLRQRVAELEGANETLERRIVGAKEQLEQLRTRLRFVGEQTTGGVR